MGKRKEYKDKLENLIKSLGEWNINCLALSKEWGIPESTVNRWKNKILDEIGPVDLKSYGREINRGMCQNLRICTQVINTSKSEASKINAIKAYNDTVKQTTDFLEQYGHKNKVADKIEHIGSIPVQINLIERSIKDIKKDKEEKLARIKDDTINNQS